MSACLGKYWEGTAFSPCKECDRFDECLAKFATFYLVEYQKQLGSNASLDNLSKLSRVSPESILLAMNFQLNMGIVTVSSTENLDNEHINVNGGEICGTDNNDFNRAITVDPSVDIATANDTGTDSDVDINTDANTGSDISTNSNAITDMGSLIADGESSTDTKNNVVECPMIKKRDKKYDLSRWERERKRSPIIAKLTPGMRLSRKWKGKLTETVVRKGYYIYDDVKYPTLYSVVVAITGTRSSPKQKRADGTRPAGTRQLTSYSAVRFFGLDKPKKKKGK
jgi:hypothetical protein